MTAANEQRRNLWHTNKSLFERRHGRKFCAARRRLADAVRVTLGPKSKCVLIEKKWGTPLVCNDGVTIAKEFDLENRKRISARR